MKKPSIYLLTCLAAGALVACSDSSESVDPSPGSEASSIAATESAEPGDGQEASSSAPTEFPETPTGEATETVASMLPDDGAAEFGVTEEERQAANALYSRLRGTSLEQETLVTAVVGGRITCNLMNSAEPDYYDPDALEMLMRDAYYNGGGDEREMLIPAASAEEFCPDLYPGDDAVDQLATKVITGG